MGIPYSVLREKGTPAIYPPNKTAVTLDVTEMGFVFAFIFLAFSFLIILPGIRGKQRWFTLIRFVIAMFIGAGILLSAWGQEWEKAEIHETHTAYKAFYSEEIVADIGVKIGLNSVNITLKAPDGNITTHPDEKINYNERFNFWGGQGRRGFGRFAGRINREFREAQWSGKPLPILWIAEYFALDGEGIRWGRTYRTAGFYAWIMIWTAFPLWILAMALSFMVLRYCGYFLMMTGGFLWLGNIMWATVRFGIELKIPFSTEKILIFSYGPTFYLCFIAGLVAVVSGFIVFIMDIRFPNELTTFFNVDPLADYEETFVYDKGTGARNGASNGGPAESETVASKPVYRQRAQSRFAVSRRRPRSSLAEVAEEANGTHDNASPGEKYQLSEKPAADPGESIPLTEIKEEANN
ncbi:dual oxidase maturation factor 1-like isoform X1 [Acanthaster planci]|uniref:Dual oxidase maturation factor 1-like isoform X1 n=1 Tax=Acanthaster planci TaxID=133434 RepID=A0A8B7YMY6_ACAPL|nr:dual oxidase maturation factor 1-like isoform X1 [Acanthaster planci]